jgi:hypothetical protein
MKFLGSAHNGGRQKIRSERIGCCQAKHKGTTRKMLSATWRKAATSTRPLHRAVDNSLALNLSLVRGAASSRPQQPICRRFATKAAETKKGGGGFVEWYEGHLEARPVITKMCTGCLLWGLGDAVAQLAPKAAESFQGDGEAKEPIDYDLPRTGRAVLFGFALHAPTSHLHFNFLEWLTNKAGITGMGIPLFKAFMEQVCMKMLEWIKGSGYCNWESNWSVLLHAGTKYHFFLHSSSFPTTVRLLGLDLQCHVPWCHGRHAGTLTRKDKQQNSGFPLGSHESTMGILGSCSVAQFQLRSRPPSAQCGSTHKCGVDGTAQFLVPARQESQSASQ